MKSDTGIEKRILIFLLLTFGFFVLYGYLVNHFMPKPAPETPGMSKPPAKTVEKRVEQRAPVLPSRPPEKAPAPVPVVRGEWQPVQASAEETLTLETDLYRITWTNKGGAPLSWKLKKHFDVDKKPLELIPQVAKPIRPFYLLDPKGQPVLDLNTALYAVHRSTSARGTQVLEFEYADSRRHIIKRFEFTRGHYDFRVHVTLEDRQHPDAVYYLIWGPGLENTSPKERKAMGWSFRPIRGIYFDGNDHNIRKKADTFKILTEGSFRWAGVHSNFFLAAFVGDEKPLDAVLFAVKPLRSYFATSSADEDKKVSKEFKKYLSLLMIAGVPVTPDHPATYHVYVGPKDIDQLTRVDPTLSEVIQYGFFGFFSKALLVVLKFCYENIYPNYGIAIILVTILLRILLWPLSHKMFVNAERMKVVQPKIKKINEKYKKIPLNDPRRKKMNEELMRIYQEHGVNPLSGCLPMLIQLPILFGFYRLLSVAIELRGAPFALWIQDLSRPDPYLVTPILMGVSMILQQKLSPTTVDPKQQRMSYIFSVVFTFMFANAQSGLVLYWLFNNVLSIAQQQFYHRFLLKRKAGAEPVSKKGKKSKKMKKRNLQVKTR